MKIIKLIFIIMVVVFLASGCKQPRANAKDPFFISADSSTAPAVSSDTLTADAVDVRADSSIEISFTKPMDRDSVETAFGLTGTAAVSGTFNWADIDTVMTFIPDDVLTYYQSHSAAVSIDAADVHGNKLGTAWSKSFTSSGAVGRLDADFNGQGWLIHDDAEGPTPNDSGSAMIIDSEGRILVAGLRYNSNEDKDMIIWRHNSDGSPDLSFGQIGKKWGWVVHHNAAGGDGDDYARAIAVDSAGNIIVTGASFNGTDEDMVIWRYTGDGLIDDSFGTNGVVRDINVSGGALGQDSGASIVITGLPGNEYILVGGRRYNGTDMDMAIWKYDKNGDLDTAGFNNPDGFVVHNSAAGGSGYDEGTDIAIDSDGNILVSGTSQSIDYSGFAVRDMVIWRYSSEGALQKVVTQNNAGEKSRCYGNALALDASGNILVAGKNFRDLDTNIEDMVIWRFDSNIDLDTAGFNPPDGYVMHDNAAGGNGFDFGYGIAIDSAGKILVVGGSDGDGSNDDMVIWRYNNDGSIDTTFNERGYVSHNSAAGGNSFDVGSTLVIDSNDKIIVTGKSVGVSTGEDMVLWRYE